MKRIRPAVAFALCALAQACGGVDPGEPIAQQPWASTFPNDKPAFDYFVGKGLTDFQAAGIVGNLDQESGVDPNAVQSGGPGRGIAQWSVGGRWDTDANDNAVWFAQQQGQDVYSLQLQLDFIWYELTTFSYYGLAELQATTNVTDATIVFETEFEGCGQCAESTRIAYAEEVLAEYGGDAGAGDDAGGTPCTVTTTGETGVCLDTAACAALGNHTSWPGYCPGPTNIQCCTAVDGGASEQDASVPDTGTMKDAQESDENAGAQPDAAGDGSAQGAAHAWSSTDSGGCSVGPRGTAATAIGWAGLGLAALLLTSRRRRGNV